MPRDSEDDLQQTLVLPSDNSVYRALLKSACIDRNSGMILPEAYIPRQNGSDDCGLSVTVVTAKTVNGVLEDATVMACRFNKVRGIVTLSVAKVRAINSCLDVVPDPLDDNRNHALITGVPRIDQNRALAEYLAGQLARCSEKVWQPV